MRPRRFKVVIDNARDSCWVSGYGSRDLIIADGGRPMWNPYRRAWHCSAKHGPNLLALAEIRGYDVELREVA